MDNIKSWIDKNFNKLVDIRRWLHMNPEVGFNEHKTSKYLQKLLIASDYKITQNKDMKTGFTCEYNSGNDGPVLGIRCDMDGLLVNEQSDKKYKSTNPI